MDGVFTGAGNRNVDFLGQAVTVRSSSGNPFACIIDCGGYDAGSRGFLFRSGETAASVLAEVTVANAWKIMDNGGGIYIAGASPTIRNCRIVGNLADGLYGGGLYCSASSAHLIG